MNDQASVFLILRDYFMDSPLSLPELNTTLVTGKNF